MPIIHINIRKKINRTKQTPYTPNHQNCNKPQQNKPVFTPNKPNVTTKKTEQKYIKFTKFKKIIKNSLKSCKTTKKSSKKVEIKIHYCII